MSVTNKTPKQKPKTSPNASKFTYKNLTDLASPQLAHKSPLATIGHIDMNAFFAQVEQIRLGLSVDDPVVCVQWQALIAVSYAARKYGINRMDTVETARKKCPHVILAHAAVFKKGEGYWNYVDGLPSPLEYKVSLDPYRRESRKILKVIADCCDVVEKASVDECFLDLGRLVYDKIIADFDINVDGADDLDTVLPDIPDSLPLGCNWEGEIIKNNEEDSQLEISDWDDITTLIGSQFIHDIRQKVYDNLGYTTSGGIARNKSLAKLAGGFYKPDNQTTVPSNSISHFLQNFEIGDFTGMGGKSGESIMQMFNLPPTGSIDALKTHTLNEIETKLQDTKLSIKVYQLIRGEYQAELTPRTDVKSMTSNKNFRPQRLLTTLPDAYAWLKVYAGDLYGRLVEQDEENNSLRRPRTIAIHLRTANFVTHSKQCHVGVVKSLETLRVMIYESGCKLMKELSGSLGGGDCKSMMACTLMSLTVSNFENVNESTLIESYFRKGDVSTQDLKKIFQDATTDDVNDIDTSDDVNIVKSPKKLSRENEEYITNLFLQAKANESEQQQQINKPDFFPTKSTNQLDKITETHCYICKEPIADKQEHKDYHIALDLSNELNGSLDKSSSDTRKYKRSKLKGQSTLPF